MDFLQFKQFISLNVLIFFYYIGAVVIPVIFWLLTLWLVNKYEVFKRVNSLTKEFIWKALTIKQKIGLVGFLLLGFLFMELFWRMLFEFLIAYLQIRDAMMLMSVS